VKGGLLPANTVGVPIGGIIGGTPGTPVGPINIPKPKYTLSSAIIGASYQLLKSELSAIR